ncbi:MAG: hypothetical protein ABIL09_29470, partial [Gemmatimonadota bacterium]
HLTPAVPDAARRRALTRAVLERLRSEVDAGRPPLVGGVSRQGCGNWSLVVGYDRDVTELCHNGLDGEPAGTWSPIRGLTAPISDRDGLAGYWNGRPRGTVVPGYHGGWLVNPAFLLGDRGPAPDLPELAGTVLRRALDFHRAPSVRFFGGPHYFGAEAYDRWIAALPAMDGPADLVLDEVVRGRAAAAAFCERTAGQLPAAATHLDGAAAMYRAEVAAARSAFADLIPFRWDNPARAAWGSPSQRTAAARAVTRMLDHERAAAASLEAALSSLPG